MSASTALARDPRFRWAAVIVAVAFGVAVDLHAALVGAPLLGFVVPDAIGGLVFVVCGAIAWSRRPENFTGPLLVAVAALWWVGSNAGSPNGAVASLSFSFIGYRDVALAFLALAFPFGKLRGRGERALLAGTLAVMLVRSAVRLTLFEPSVYYDCPCPRNPFLLALNQGFFEGVDRVATFALSGLALAVMVLLIRRLWAGSETARRVSGPVVVAGIVAMGIAAFHNATDAVMVTFGIDLLPRNETLRQVVVWGLYAGRVLVPLGFLVGVLRLRGRRGLVADLVVDLAEDVPRRPLRDSLARALDDPTLEVAIWSPERATYADEAGEPVDLPSEEAARAITLIHSDDEPLAALVHDPASLEDPGLVRSVAAALRMAVENDRLRARLEEQLEEVRASRARIVAAGDEERRRVERDLHDGAQQRLLTLSLALRLARAHADGVEAPDLQRTLAGAEDELKLALGEIRELARGIHPVVLSRAGLPAALRSLAERSPVPVRIADAPADRFSPSVEAAVYFVVSESLANVAKHARASSATVSVTGSDGSLRVEVRDDGVGGAHPSVGSGLMGLQDRVAAVGGRLWVESPPGAGTTVVAELPLNGMRR